MNTLFVSEIFKSIQGEGPKLGTPSIFVRLGICNLQCAWCDTPYTWKKGFTDYEPMDVNLVGAKIEKLCWKNNVSNVVITGGEPLLQQKQLVLLLQNPVFKKMSIEIETNGSMPLLPELECPNFSFNISPKMSDSGNKAYPVHFYPTSILKFVYVSKKSEKLIDAFIKKNFQKIKNTPVFIMPEGTSTDVMEQKYAEIIDYCLRRNFHFTPRMQIYLFGNKRAT